MAEILRKGGPVSSVPAVEVVGRASYELLFEDSNLFAAPFEHATANGKPYVPPTVNILGDAIPQANASSSSFDFSLSQELGEIGKYFDVEYYGNEYPDVRLDQSQFLKHFCTLGWREGRNPNPFFDTVSYLLQNGDVARSQINPYYHYLRHGMTEGRIASSSISPSIRSRLLFGESVYNWVERLRPHVDTDFYKNRLDEPVASKIDLAAHFAYRGWREGKSPNASFDVSDWLQTHPATTRFVVNPLLIHLQTEIGLFDLDSMADDDVTNAPLLADLALKVSTSTEARELSFSSNPPRTHCEVDELALIRSEFNRTFYLNSYPDIAEAEIEAVEHFIHTGWREGRNPNDHFDTRYYLESNRDVRELAVNPFAHYLAVGRAEGRLPRPVERIGSEARDVTDDSGQDYEQLPIVAREFSADYYLAAYPDVAKAKIDPLRHFFYTGWREGRNPNLNFDTGYYLGVNGDVRDAGVNPFLHYLTSGRTEGRLPRRPGGYRRQIVDAAMEPTKRPLPAVDPSEKRLNATTLLRKLTSSIQRERPLIVSLSHDCYINVIGGTQIFIADEQSRFNELGCGYIHLSPQIARLTIADYDPQFTVRIVVDGKCLGVVDISAVIDAFGTICSKKTVSRPILVVHSILGFHIPDVTRLAAMLRAERRIYWLHDYSSICAGFNLLRNDAEFCGAPPEGSLACRICVYGNTRQRHVESIRELFKACKFDVLSPSAFTLKLWCKAIDLPKSSQGIHPHWQLVPGGAKSTKRRKGSGRKCIHVAFVGFTSPNKGWPLFSELVQRFSRDPRYKFFHFAARDTPTLPSVTFVRSEVTPTDRHATQRLLAAKAIDLVLMLSPWPETFSFVAHEAIAAGAKIICLSDSGNVAELVTGLECGQILQDGAALVDFFDLGSAVLLVKKATRPPPTYDVVQVGTTATVKDIEWITAKAVP